MSTSRRNRTNGTQRDGYTQPAEDDFVFSLILCKGFQWLVWHPMDDFSTAPAILGKNIPHSRNFPLVAVLHEPTQLPPWRRQNQTKSNTTIMRYCLQILFITAGAVSLSFGEEGPAKPEKTKVPNPEKLFKKLDTDSNGSLSLEEFKASARAKKNEARAEKMYKRMDNDSKDGVSLAEFTAAQPAPGKAEGKKRTPEN